MSSVGYATFEEDELMLFPICFILIDIVGVIKMSTMELANYWDTSTV
jgi:hypothetical protein